jgi:hypothetical protein
VIASEVADNGSSSEKAGTKETLKVIFIIMLSFLVLVLPPSFFLVACIAEIRAHESGQPVFFLRMGEIAAGFIFFGVYFAYWGVTHNSASSLSWTMVCVSLVLGGASLISKYESRVALRCVVLGSIFLALLWYFNGAYHH